MQHAIEPLGDDQQGLHYGHVGGNRSQSSRLRSTPAELDYAIKSGATISHKDNKPHHAGL